jgi:hypothetical protein
MDEQRGEVMAVRRRATHSMPAGVETAMVTHRSADEAELARVRARVHNALNRPAGAARRPGPTSSATPKPKRANRVRTTNTLAGSTPELQRVHRHLERIT